MAVSVPGGHMAGSLAYEAHTAAEAAAFVEKIAGDKPNLIKLMITGGVLDAEVVGEPGVLRMPPRARQGPRATRRILSACSSRRTLKAPRV